MIFYILPEQLLVMKNHFLKVVWRRKVKKKKYLTEKMKLKISCKYSCNSIWFGLLVWKTLLPKLCLLWKLRSFGIRILIKIIDFLASFNPDWTALSFSKEYLNFRDHQDSYQNGGFESEIIIFDSFAFAELSLVVLNDEKFTRKGKSYFQNMIKFFEQNIAYCKLRERTLTM